MSTNEVKDEEPAESVKEEVEQTVEVEPIPDTPVDEMSTAEVKDEPAVPIKEETEQSVEAETPAEENAPTPSKGEETSEDLPDPTLTVKDMNDSGYLKEDMLPISKERATEFMEQDITVYALHSDNTEEMLFDVSEIEEQSGNMFGIAKEDWEQIKNSAKLPTVAELEQRENKPKSIMSKLKAPAVRQDKPKAPSKSAEMEI